MRERFLIPFNENTRLVAYRWSNPEISMIGCILIAHGLSEHITRYNDFAEFLVNRGFTVIGSDHFGHGESCADVKKNGQIEEDDFINKVIQSIHLTRQYFKSDFKGITCLFGHSMGSIATQSYIQRYPNEFQKVILSGTDVGDFKYVFLKLLTYGKVKKHDYLSSSKLIYNLTFGNFAKKFKEESPFNWLSKNQKNVKDYEADPLCGAPVSDATYYSIAKTLRTSFKTKSIKMIYPNIEILIFSGAKDHVSCMGKSVKKLYKKYLKQNLKVKMKLYDELRHETLNELENRIVYQDILDFLIK